MPEPTPADWLKIGNDMRRVLGLKPLEEATRPPTEEELADWDRLIPGAAEALRENAREEMEHRLRMEAKPMKWQVYDRKGRELGVVEANSVGVAYRLAQSLYQGIPDQGGVALIDDEGPGVYSVVFAARHLGALGDYDGTAGYSGFARSAADAMDLARRDTEDLELGNPIHVEYMGDPRRFWIEDPTDGSNVLGGQVEARNSHVLECIPTEPGKTIDDLDVGESIPVRCKNEHGYRLHRAV